MKLEVTATYHANIDPADFADEFREAHEMEEDSDIDADELAAFAMDAFHDQVVDYGPEEYGLEIHAVTVEKRL